jgi:hypothetical protein
MSHIKKVQAHVAEATDRGGGSELTVVAIRDITDALAVRIVAARTRAALHALDVDIKEPIAKHIADAAVQMKMIADTEIPAEVDAPQPLNSE